MSLEGCPHGPIPRDGVGSAEECMDCVEELAMVVKNATETPQPADALVGFPEPTHRRPQRQDETDEVFARQMAIDYRVVIPVLTQKYADQCVASLLDENGASGFCPDRVLLVDNSRKGFVADRYTGAGDPSHHDNEQWRDTRGVDMDRARQMRVYRDPDGHQLGVARSWNIGAREVLDHGLDYLVICSAAMQFGPILNTTFIRELARYADPSTSIEEDICEPAHIVEAEGHGWHLVAIHRRVFEQIGLWDPAFYPAYFEANDHCRRMKLVGLEGGAGWVNVWINAMSQAVAGHNQVVACPAQPLLDFYYNKWYGHKGEERFIRPWGDKSLDHIVEEPIPVLAERYGLGPRGEGWW